MTDIIEAMAQAIDDWQTETHWYGDALPSDPIAQAALAAALAYRSPDGRRLVWVEEVREVGAIRSARTAHALFREVPHD